MPTPSSNRVILIYGLWNVAPILWPLQYSLKNHGWRPEIWDYPSTGYVALDELARNLEKYIDSHHTGKPHIVAYSMGGLIARYFIQKLGGTERISSFITLATPHHGTVRANILPGEGFVQMRVGSEFLRDLNSDLTPLTRIPFISLWTPWDITVFPAKNSYLEEFPRMKIQAPLHNLITWMPSSLRVVNHALRGAEVALARQGG